MRLYLTILMILLFNNFLTFYNLLIFLIVIKQLYCSNSKNTKTETLVVTRARRNPASLETPHRPPPSTPSFLLDFFINHLQSPFSK